MRKVISIYYLSPKKGMAKASKFPLSHNAEEVKRQLTMVPAKLDQIITTYGISYNRLASVAQFRPDTLYRIRDGEALPACETIANVKNVLPDINLNWWLCDQGNATVKENEVLVQENERLQKELHHMRTELRKVRQQLSDIIDPEASQ